MDWAVNNNSSIMEKCGKHNKATIAFCKEMMSFYCPDCPEYFSEYLMMTSEEIKANADRTAAILKQHLEQPSKKYKKDELLKQLSQAPWLKSSPRISELLKSIQSQEHRLFNSPQQKLIQGSLCSPGINSLLLTLQFYNPDQQLICTHAQTLTQRLKQSLCELHDIMQNSNKKPQPLRGTQDFQILNSRSALMVEIDSDKEEEYEPVNIPSSDVIRQAAAEAIEKIEQLVRRVAEKKGAEGVVAKGPEGNGDGVDHGKEEIGKGEVGGKVIMKDSQAARKTLEEEEKAKEVPAQNIEKKEVEQVVQPTQQQPEEEDKAETKRQIRESVKQQLKQSIKQNPIGQNPTEPVQEKISNQPQNKPQPQKQQQIYVSQAINIPTPQPTKPPELFFPAENTAQVEVNLQPVQISSRPKPPPLFEKNTPTTTVRPPAQQQQLQRILQRQRQEAQKLKKQEQDNKIRQEQQRKQRQRFQANRKAKALYEQTKLNRTIIQTVQLLSNVKKYSQALAKLSEVSAQLLQTPSLLRTKAKLLYHSGDIRQSIATYNKLVELQPNEPKHLMEKAMIQLQANQIPECEKSIRMRRHQIPTYYIIKGDLNVRKGQYQEALECYLDANRRRETALAFGRIAHCYMRSGEWAKAAKNLDNASRLDGKNSQFFNDRCYCYMKLKNFDEAYKSICMAISLTQNSSAISNNCAVAQLSKNGGLPTVTILDQIKKAFDLNRDDLRIVLNYCIIHQKLVGPAQTIKLYENPILQKFKTNPRFAIAMYKTMLKTNNKQYINKAYGPLVELYNNNRKEPQLMFMMCKCMCLRGDIGQSNEIGRKIMVYALKDERVQGKEKGDAQNTMARFYANIQSWKQAAEQLRMAIMLQPDSAIFLYNLAYCLYRGSSFLQALNSLQKIDAMAIVDQNIQKKAIILRLNIHAKLGQKSQAGRLIRLVKQKNKISDTAFISELTNVAKSL